MPRTPDGNDADSEDIATIPRTSSYGTVGKSKSSLRQRSPLPPKPGDTHSATDSVQPVPMVDTPKQLSTGSDDSTTPIVPLSRSRSKKSASSAKVNQTVQRQIRQVFDSVRRGRKGITDSLEGTRLAPENFEFDSSELVFLQWLDTEIKKIDDFYIEKEDDAEERFKLLSAQLEALRHLREAQRLAESNATTESVSRAETIDGKDRFASGMWMRQPITSIRASLDGLRSTMPGADHERRAKQPKLMAHPISTSTGYVEYRVAKRRLKQAVLEFYRGMELLKNYRLLNRTGISKILKKFDKTAGRNMKAEYVEKLKSLRFEVSAELEKIMERTEVCRRYGRIDGRTCLRGTLNGIIGKTLLNDYGREINRTNMFLPYSTLVSSSASRYHSSLKESSNLGNLPPELACLKQAIFFKYGVDYRSSFFSFYSSESIVGYGITLK